MTPDQLTALAARLREGCRDPVTGERLRPGEFAGASIEDVEAAAEYLRQCAQAEPVATVRVHNTGGNAGIAWSGVPTENAGTMRGGTPLYTHPQPQQAGVPEGWKLVPVEPTVEMRRAGTAANDGIVSDIYRAMLAAAPQPPSAQTDATWTTEECARVLKTLQYVIGIAERGAGRKMREDETVETFVLSYVRRLERSSQADAVTQCNCTLAQRAVGDGCEACNPEMARRLAAEAQADVVEALRRLVVAIIDDDGDDPDNAPGHAHSIPGIWDDDNEPAIAGKPCEKCAAWSNARAVLAAQGAQHA